MAITVPGQTRSLDPYADHRFSNTINRFTRVFTNGKDIILPYDDQEFNLALQTTTDSTNINNVFYSWTANKAVRIGGGLCIKDDTLIHVTKPSYVIFTDPTNYVGAGAGYNAFDATGKYFILLSYTYARSIPAPQASIVIAKQRTEFLTHRDRYIYLGTANVVYTSGAYKVDSIALTDVDETDSNEPITRPNYEFTLSEFDGGDLDED